DPTVTWRGIAAALGRLDLNRPLPNYPILDPRSGRIAITASVAIQRQFRAAEYARQLLARDICWQLIRATGAYDPRLYNPAPPPGTPPVPAPTPEELNALRWLAQLA